MILIYARKYENIVLLGWLELWREWSCNGKHTYNTYNLKNLVNKPTCLKNVNNPRTIYLILTNKNKCFFHNDVIEIGLSDFQQMPLTVLKSNYIKCKSKVKTYRWFNGFNKVSSMVLKLYLTGLKNITIAYSLKELISLIKKWQPNNCTCRLCKTLMVLGLLT